MPVGRFVYTQDMTSPFHALPHAPLAFDAPLSEERATALVRELPVAPGRHVLDLGCGSAELLLRLVAAHPGTTGTGVDTGRAALDRGRAAAAARGLAERVELVEGDVTSFADQGDLVLAVGVSHAWGGAGAALAALHAHLEPGAALLFADGFWERTPSEEALATVGELPGWDALAELAVRLGYRVVTSDRSTADELDAFASARAGSEHEAAAARAHRGTLGFAWLRLVAAP